MFKAIKRWWRYMGAWVGGKADAIADPRIQIEQAIEEAKEQHRRLTQQAAAVLANQRQVEIQLGRGIDDVEKTKQAVAQALRLTDEAARRGDAEKAQQYTQAAQTFATQLVAKERSVEELKSLHDKSLQAADAAKRAVEQNAYALQQKLSERTKLLTQLEAARMQEQMNTALETVSELSPKGSTPTLDEVRNKIEQRYARAMGVADLQSTSVETKMLDIERATMDAAAMTRLEEIRRGLGLPEGGTTVRDVTDQAAIASDAPKGIGGGTSQTIGDAAGDAVAEKAAVKRGDAADTAG